MAGSSGPTVSVTPVFDLQSLPTILASGANPWSNPGAYVKDIGLSYNINDGNFSGSVALTGRWSTTQTGWSDTAPTLTASFKLNKLFGGTLNVNGTGSYDTADQDFNYAAHINWNIDF